MWSLTMLDSLLAAKRQRCLPPSCPRSLNFKPAYESRDCTNILCSTEFTWHKYAILGLLKRSSQPWDMLNFNLLFLWLKVNGTLGCHSIVLGLSSGLPSIVLWSGVAAIFSMQNSPIFLPVATALLVAGLTLTLWMPGQTLFASTSSCSGLVQRLPAACIMQVANLWLIPINAHDTCWPCCLSSSGVSNCGQKAKKYILQRSQLCLQGDYQHVSLVHNGDHDSVDRIFMGLFWELYCHWESDQVLKQQCSNKRAQNSITKMSFCTIILRA